MQISPFHDHICLTFFLYLALLSSFSHPIDSFDSRHYLLLFLVLPLLLYFHLTLCFLSLFLQSFFWTTGPRRTHTSLLWSNHTHYPNQNHFTFVSTYCHICLMSDFYLIFFLSFTLFYLFATFGMLLDLINWNFTKVEHLFFWSWPTFVMNWVGGLGWLAAAIGVNDGVNGSNETTIECVLRISTFCSLVLHNSYTQTSLWASLGKSAKLWTMWRQSKEYKSQ